MKVKNGNKPRTDLKASRKKEAAERLQDWSSLTIEQRLKDLEGRRGESKKQKQKLHLLIESINSSYKSNEKNSETKNSQSHLRAKDRRLLEQSKNKQRT